MSIQCGIGRPAAALTRGSQAAPIPLAHTRCTAVDCNMGRSWRIQPRRTVPDKRYRLYQCRLPPPPFVISRKQTSRSARNRRHEQTYRCCNDQPRRHRPGASHHRTTWRLHPRRLGVAVCSRRRSWVASRAHSPAAGPPNLTCRGLLAARSQRCAAHKSPTCSTRPPSVSPPLAHIRSSGRTAHALGADIAAAVAELKRGDGPDPGDTRRS